MDDQWRDLNAGVTKMDSAKSDEGRRSKPVDDLGRSIDHEILF